MKSYPVINPKFVTDEGGNRLGVFLDMNDFVILLDEIEDRIDVEIAEAIIEQNQKTYTAEEIEKKYLGK